jgi:flagellar hook-associated protein FlgK
VAETFIPFDPKKVPAGVIITGGTTAKTKRYQGTALVDVVATEPLLADRNKLLQDFEGFTADYRKALSQKLKAAGYYRGDVTGKPSLKLQEAYFNAYEDLNAYTRERFTALPAAAQQTTPIDNLESFLSKQTDDDGGGADKITKIQQQKKYSPDTIEASIDKVFRDLTGAGASKAQIAKYTKNIQKQLADPKNFGQTEYKDMGGGVQRQIVTEAAFDPEAFLIEEVSKGDPAKASSVMGFYEVFNKFIGRG